jgi:hypothetical protein
VTYSALCIWLKRLAFANRKSRLASGDWISAIKTPQQLLYRMEFGQLSINTEVVENSIFLKKGGKNAKESSARRLTRQLQNALTCCQLDLPRIEMRFLI